jgi:DNA-binding response OmpR family regulator
MTMPSAQATEHPRRVLIVDDDEEARRDFCDALQGAGFECAEAWSVVQAMRLLLSFRPHAVVLDLILPDGHGVEIGQAMRAIVTTQRTCVVAVTSSPASVTLMDPASFGARTILLKPLAREALLAAVSQCFDDGPPIAPGPDIGPREAVSPD